eukprot:m.358624 g.358624  ORF g.358624 m.358624 type:complete len:693 (+) comp18212_c0_seq1:107-2185(+)
MPFFSFRKKGSKASVESAGAKSKKGDKKASKKSAKPTRAGGRAAAAAKNWQNRQAAHKVHRGRLYLTVSLNAGTLLVDLEEARDIQKLNKDGTSSPFISVKLVPDETGQGEKVTPVKANVKKAKFTDKFKFTIPPNTNMEYTRVYIEMKHDGGKKKKKATFMGCMSFSMAEVEDEETPTAGWFRFMDQQKGVNQNHPFRVKRRQEMTAEQMEIYGVYGAYADTEVEPTPDAGARGAAAVNLASFNLLKVLGRGAFGKVLLAEKKGTSDIFAIKLLSKPAVIDDDDVEATMTERKVLALAGECPFLTSIHATFQTPERLYFVMEFINGGDLMFHIQKVEQFPLNQAAFFLAEICLGLWFLHDRGIIYRDLKLDNVMLAGDGHIKLADFGLCKENIWGAATTTTFCGTPGYLAPEIVEELPYGNSVDWWSLGVLAYELITGGSPFDGEDEDELFEQILSDPIDFPSSTAPAAKSLISGFMTRDPLKRLGCGSTGKEDIKAHAVFSEYNWADLEARKVDPPYKPTPAGDAKSSDNFDPEFTTMAIEDTPIEADEIEDIDQGLFAGFSFYAAGPGAALPDASQAPLHEFPWYRPDLGRTAATDLVKRTSPGRFLVRESSTQPGCYAITVWLGDKVWHGVISPGSNILGERIYKLYAKNKFKSIPELVQHYHTRPIARSSAGANVVLVGEDEEDDDE